MKRTDVRRSSETMAIVHGLAQHLVSFCDALNGDEINEYCPKRQPAMA
jgi:hypothetical protein